MCWDKFMKDFRELFDDLLVLEDPMDKYEWIIDYGFNTTELDIKYRTDANLVRGCTSPLWVVKVNNRLQAQGDSSIVNGIAAMICDWYNQANEEQRKELSLTMLESIGLAPLLSMGRQNGVANLIKTIQTL
jgi:cysteine desulfuration protein SufE